MRKYKYIVATVIFNCGVMLYASSIDYSDIIQQLSDKSGSMSASEYEVIVQAVNLKAPCNMLVFGVGNDTPLWLQLNKNGRTVFLEDSANWLQVARNKNMGLEAYLVSYGTNIKEWFSLASMPDKLTLGMPSFIKGIKWDIILVDAPMGWGFNESCPGRMKSIYEATRLAQLSTNVDVFVHDCDREVERFYTDSFLGNNNLIEQVKRLRHYRIH